MEHLNFAHNLLLYGSQNNRLPMWLITITAPFVYNYYEFFFSDSHVLFEKR